MAEKHPTGPRGGTTTRTKSGLYRVVIYLHEDEVKALKKRAYEEDETRSAVARQAIRQYLNVED